MISKPVLFGVYLAIAFLGSRDRQTQMCKIILHGKVVMSDGSPPPVIVGIERICSDSLGRRQDP